MVQLPCFDSLRGYVQSVLCGKADLEDSIPLLESTLYRAGQPCGIEYTLLAPRSVRLSAIWNAPERRIRFYDQNLERFLVADVEGPNAASITDRPMPSMQLTSLWAGK